MGSIARLAGLEDLAGWIADVAAQGGVRFELWVKVRGSEQERAHRATSNEAYDLADELLSRVERDRRVELGQASYVVLAFGTDEKAPLERAFLSPAPRAMVLPALLATSGVQDINAYPSIALTTVLSTMHQMTQEVFGALQRENESQRHNNESLFRATTGHFENYAKSYERTFEDMQKRHDAVLREASELRVTKREAEEKHSELSSSFEELSKVKLDQAVKAQERARRNEFFMQQLGMIAPFVVSKLTRQPLPAMPGLGSFFDSLREEQLQAILGTLDDAQRLVVIEMLKAHDASKPKADSPTPAPEAAPSLVGGDDVAKEAAQKATPAKDPSPEGAAFTAAEEQAFLAMTHTMMTARYRAWLEQFTAETPAQSSTPNPDAQPPSPVSAVSPGSEFFRGATAANDPPKTK